MSLNSYELERIADDVYKDRRITGHVYCGECGYDLHSLPYIHVCPECGNKYNARPLSMKGIFAPHEIEFPFRDIIVTAVCGFAMVAFTVQAVASLDVTWVVLAVTFVALTIALVLYLRSRLGRYFKAIEIARRVAAQEADI